MEEFTALLHFDKILYLPFADDVIFGQPDQFDRTLKEFVVSGRSSARPPTRARIHPGGEAMCRSPEIFPVLEDFAHVRLDVLLELVDLVSLAVLFQLLDDVLHVSRGTSRSRPSCRTVVTVPLKPGRLSILTLTNDTKDHKYSSFRCFGMIFLSFKNVPFDYEMFFLHAG